MGCSAAKNLTVEPLDGGDGNKNAIIENEEPRKVSIPHVPPLEGEDPQTELLESGAVNNIQKGVNGMAFDIAFENNAEESIIKKHPPKRFQKLEDNQVSPTVTLVKLQEKLEEAEIRRQQILQQRIQSAKFRSTLKQQNSASSNDENHLQVPSDHVALSQNPYDVSYL